MLQCTAIIVETVAPGLIYTSLRDVEQALLVQCQVHNLLTRSRRVFYWHAHLRQHCCHDFFVVQGCELVIGNWDRTTSLLRLFEGVNWFIDNEFVGASWLDDLIDWEVTALKDCLVVPTRWLRAIIIGWYADAYEVVRSLLLHCQTARALHTVLHRFLDRNLLLSHRLQVLRFGNLEVILSCHS